MYIVIALLGIIQVITLKSYLFDNTYMVIFDGINQYMHFFSEFSVNFPCGKGANMLHFTIKVPDGSHENEPCLHERIHGYRTG